MKNLTWQNPEQLFVAQELINKVKSKCCGIKDYYSQPGDLFRLMTPAQQQVLFENTARAMGDIPEEIKLRHIRNCMKADENYGKGVAKALNIPLEKI